MRDAKRAGLSWPDAREDAAKKLAKTKARGKASTMKADYDEVVRDLKAGRRALYFFKPKIPKFGKAQPTIEQVNKLNRERSQVRV